MSKIICAICEGVIEIINDGKDTIIESYDGCEER